MEELTLRNRQLCIDIKPAIVFLNCLTEMKKLSTWAVLIVTEKDVFQIFAPCPPGACSMDMKSSLVYPTTFADDYCLYLDLQLWYDLLHPLILLEPTASISLLKACQSTDAVCFVGKREKEISFGQAKFVRSQAIETNIPNSIVRITMKSQLFQKFICVLPESGHPNTDAAIQLLITRKTVRWTTPSGSCDYDGKLFKFEGLTEPDADLRIEIRWDLKVFKMLRLSAIGHERVEFSLYENIHGVRMYRFRFLSSTGKFMFCYTERENVPIV